MHENPKIMAVIKERHEFIPLTKDRENENFFVLAFGNADTFRSSSTWDRARRNLIAAISTKDD
jgi:hypothetical protein